MGWTDSHLHQFIVGEEYYGVPSSEDWRPVLNERRHRLNQIAPSENSKFVYEYDFGDSWDHVILVEKIQPSDLESQFASLLYLRRKPLPTR